jgi:hypothetical protein
LLAHSYRGSQKILFVALKNRAIINLFISQVGMSKQKTLAIPHDSNKNISLQRFGFPIVK